MARNRSNSFCCSPLKPSSFSCCSRLNFSKSRLKSRSTHFCPDHFKTANATAAEGMPMPSAVTSQCQRVVKTEASVVRHTKLSYCNSNEHSDSNHDVQDVVPSGLHLY